MATVYADPLSEAEIRRLWPSLADMLRGLREEIGAAQGQLAAIAKGSLSPYNQRQVEGAEGELERARLVLEVALRECMGRYQPIEVRRGGRGLYVGDWR
jgi:hypothetical protein